MNAVSRNMQVPLIDAVKNHPGANVADAYRSLVRAAIGASMDPVEIDLAKIPRVSVFFPPSLSASVNEIAGKQGWTFQQCVAGLAAAGADTRRANQAPDIDIPAPFKSNRPDQKVFYQDISRGMLASKVVVAEASTGIGKGRALIASAIDAVQSGKVPTIVAAPTIAILNQLWDELQKLRNKGNGIGVTVNATILLGSAEFCDDVKLTEWVIENPGVDDAVAAWALNGAKHTADDAIAQAAAEQGIAPAWLMSDLKAIATNLPPDDFRLDRVSKDKDAPVSDARMMLGSLRHSANKQTPSLEIPGEMTHAGAELIFCTHAMLALGQKTQWRALPKPQALYVDEAHLLEETISRINSTEVSFYALGYRIARYCKAIGAKPGSVPSWTLLAAIIFIFHAYLVVSKEWVSITTVVNDIGPSIYSGRSMW